MEKQTLREYLNWYQAIRSPAVTKSQGGSGGSGNKVQRIEEKLQNIKKMIGDETQEEIFQKVVDDLNRAQQTLKHEKENSELNLTGGHNKKKSSKLQRMSMRRSRHYRKKSEQESQRKSEQENQRKSEEENQCENKGNISRNTLLTPEEFSDSFINMKLSIFAPRQEGNCEVLRQIFVTNKENKRDSIKERRPRKLVSFLPPELSRQNINFFDMMDEVSTRNI